MFKFFMDRLIQKKSIFIFFCAICVANIEAANSELEESVRALTGRVEELEKKISEKAQGDGSIGTEGETVQEEMDSITNKAPEEVIEIAKDMINEGRAAAARKLLNAFISKNPKSIFCGMMQYYIGKSFFQEKDYQNAAIKYMESFETNSKGEKSAKALYQLSLCFKKLSEINKCKAILEKIETDYPGPFAKKASRDLKKLKNAK